MHRRTFFLLEFPLLLLITAACGGQPLAPANASVAAQAIVVDDRDEQIELNGVWKME